MTATSTSLNLPSSPLSAWATLGLIISKPSHAYTRLRQRSTPWLPLLLTTLSTAGLFFWYFQVVDFAWMMDMLFAHEKMGAKEKVMAIQMFNKNFFLLTSIGDGLFALLLIYAVNALYFVLLSNFKGWDFKFNQWFGFCAWSAVPGWLAIPLGAIQIFLATNGQLALNQINPISLNQLFFHLEFGMKWASLLNAINLTTFWVLGLQTLGLTVWTGLSRAQSALWACLPHVLYFVGWALIVMLKG